LPEPIMADQHQIVLQHFEEILSHYGETTGVKIARKHIGWYSKGIVGSSDFRAAVSQVESATDMRVKINEFYRPLYT